MKSSDIICYTVLITLATFIGLMAGWVLWKAIILAFLWLGFMEVLRKYL